MARDVGNVNHAHVHADVSHVVQAISASVAQMAVQAVGIANGQGGYA